MGMEDLSGQAARYVHALRSLRLTVPEAGQVGGLGSSWVAKVTVRARTLVGSAKVPQLPARE